jgi:hypothetical protein
MPIRSAKPTDYRFKELCHDVDEQLESHGLIGLVDITTSLPEDAQEVVPDIHKDIAIVYFIFRSKVIGHGRDVQIVLPVAWQVVNDMQANPDHREKWVDYMTKTVSTTMVQVMNQAGYNPDGSPIFCPN